MKIKTISLLFLITLIKHSYTKEEDTPDDNTPIKDPDAIDTSDIDDTIQTLEINVEEETIDLQNEMDAILDKIRNVVGMSFQSISQQTIIKNWREGLAIEKDLDFEELITHYQLKTVYDHPCKSINFLFAIKGDLEVYQFNAKRFMLCFLKYYDLEVKEILSDIIVEGGVNILKSGFSNPVSTFFSNLLIIEGPLKLKEELFAAIYKYVDTNSDYHAVFSELIELIIKVTFQKAKYKCDLDKFVKVRSTTLTFFFFDIISTYMKNNDVYLSAYDFIQPDANMVTNMKSMDPKYISDNFSMALESDLSKFKRIRDNYVENPASTIYHKAYAKYVEDNIAILEKFLHGK